MNDWKVKARFDDWSVVVFGVISDQSDQWLVIGDHRFTVLVPRRKPTWQTGKLTLRLGAERHWWILTWRRVAHRFDCTFNWNDWHRQRNTIQKKNEKSKKQQATSNINIKSNAIHNRRMTNDADHRQCLYTSSAFCLSLNRSGWLIGWLADQK